LQCHLAGHVTTDDAIIDEPNIRHEAVEVPPGCVLNVMEVRHGQMRLICRPSMR
jgi:hypothetical protein